MDDATLERLQTAVVNLRPFLAYVSGDGEQ